jgi:hypothetical protein
MIQVRQYDIQQLPTRPRFTSSSGQSSIAPSRRRRSRSAQAQAFAVVAAVDAPMKESAETPALVTRRRDGHAASSSLRCVADRTRHTLSGVTTSYQLRFTDSCNCTFSLTTWNQILSLKHIITAVDEFHLSYVVWVGPDARSVEDNMVKRQWCRLLLHGWSREALL